MSEFNMSSMFLNEKREFLKEMIRKRLFEFQKKKIHIF